MTRNLTLFLLPIGAAVAYGLCLDQITIRLCPEYFTIGHPTIVASDSLTVIALAWGVVATWWAGAALGTALVFANNVGSQPPAPLKPIARQVGLVLVGMAAVSLAAGLVGWALAELRVVDLVGSIRRRVPQSAHVAFLRNLWIHNASYLGGLLGGLWICRTIWVIRRHA